MKRRGFVLLFGHLAAALVLAPSVAEAKGKTAVDVGAVEWKTPSKEAKSREKRLSTEIRRAAHKAAKGLNFGNGGRALVSFTVVEVGVENLGDVVRVTCLLVGHLKGGGRARSKIRFGGKPEDQKKLEKQVVIAATDGVMTRLSEMARAKAEE